MERSQWFDPKFRALRQSAVLALAAVLPVALAVVLREPAIAALAVIFLLPLLFWLVVIPVLHWRERYRGDRVTLWGALMVLETSGWSKLVYWLRHVLPDRSASGRYSDAA